jgi:hypothetical protein
MDLKIILQQQISNADYNTHIAIFKYIIKSKINYELNDGVKFDLNILTKNQIKKLLKVTKKFQKVNDDMILFAND